MRRAPRRYLPGVQPIGNRLTRARGVNLCAVDAGLASKKRIAELEKQVADLRVELLRRRDKGAV